MKGDSKVLAFVKLPSMKLVYDSQRIQSASNFQMVEPPQRFYDLKTP